GISLQCDRVCSVIEGRNWKNLLSAMHESIVFVDEGNSFVKTYEFASAIQESDNYYVLVCREALPMLPYSVTEIYGIRDSGKYGVLKQVYNEMYQIYGQENIADQLYPNKVIVEDSNAGFQFFESICSKSGLECIAAGGKSKIFSQLCNMDKDNVLVIADGAAFGCEMEKVMALVSENKGTYLYLPESFEWLLLNSEIIKDRDLKNILDNPSDYVASEDYNSWERFFTGLLVKMTQGTYLAYAKNELNKAYLQGNIPEKV
ncbi:MAG: translation initiation factor 2, partial [Acetatifactor sp.]|nr:translation initiation factor 2 [Acetatifactor sp.]